MNGKQNQKHKNQFLSKQTLGPFGWGIKKWEGTKLILTKNKKLFRCEKIGG